jgi:hypothetical protein
MQQMTKPKPQARNKLTLAVAKEEAEYINREKEEFLKSSSTAALQANETFRTLSGQLVLVAGTVITVSAAFLTSDSSKVPVGNHAKYLLVSAWILLGGSIVSGIVSLYSDANFFVSWQKYHFALAKELGTGKYTSKTIGKIYEVHKEKRPRDRGYLFPLYIQFILMGLGGLLFMVLIIHLELRK